MDRLSSGSCTGCARPAAALRMWASSFRSFKERNELVSDISELIRNHRLDPEGRRRFEAIQLVALYYNGRGREAHELACRLRPRLPLRGATDEAILSAYVSATIETGEGLDELGRWAAVTLKEAVALGDRGAAGMAALALANKRLVEGRFVDADRWLAEAQLHQERHDPVGLLAGRGSVGRDRAWPEHGGPSYAGRCCR
jgi:hypothetical protein